MDNELRLFSVNAVYEDRGHKFIDVTYEYTNHNNKTTYIIAIDGINVEYLKRTGHDVVNRLKEAVQITILDKSDIYSVLNKCYGTLKLSDGDIIEFRKASVRNVKYEQHDDKNDDTYWNRITDIYNKQRKKGIETYGQTLEENDYLTEEERLNYLEEELVDALMYIEHIKAKMNENKVSCKEDLRDDDDV